MKREINVCDRCKKTAETKEEKEALALTDISVGRKPTYSSYGGNTVYPANKEWSAEWCLTCCKEVGVARILPPQPRHTDTMSAPAPSLEDMIREIVREQVAANGS